MPEQAVLEEKRPVREQSPSCFTVGAAVDSETETGEDFAKPILGAIVCRTGLMRGWGQWVDHAFLDQMCKLGNAAPDGVKAHLDHYSGVGRIVGSYKNYRRKGDVARADFYPDAAAALSPDFTKDPRPWIHQMALTQPQKFGNSIVWCHDWEAEDAFMLKHGGTPVKMGDQIMWVSEKGFKSPDPLNTMNAPHVRIRELMATDIVDETATGAGMFSAAVNYVKKMLGMAPSPAGDKAEDRPAAEATSSAAPEKEKEMTEQEVKAQLEAAEKKGREEYAAKTREIFEAFKDDAAFASKMIQEGKSLLEAKAAYADVLAAKNKELAQANETLKTAALKGAAPAEGALSEAGAQKFAAEASQMTAQGRIVQLPKYEAVKALAVAFQTAHKCDSEAAWRAIFSDPAHRQAISEMRAESRANPGQA